MKKIYILIYLSLLLMIGITNGQTHLWGTCTSGGRNYDGTFFIADPNGNSLDSNYSFIDAIGADPLDVFTVGNDCKFYGVTNGGGCYDSCVFYSYDPNTRVFLDLHDFSCYSQYGVNAYSKPIWASDGKLYGTASSGGVFSGGVIYMVDPVTNVYSDIYDLNNSDGGRPEGTLIQLSDGKLYGMTLWGGANGYGVIFNFNPVDSAFSILYSFNQADSVVDDFNGGLFQASDSKLYGMTKLAGLYNYGSIFSFDLSTSLYTDVHDFDSLHGKTPYASLIQATNGLLYGMTQMGGVHNYGVIFNFDINTGTYSDLLDFNGTNGAGPMRSLMQASNGLLYGTTFGGLPHGYGVFFSFNINNDSLIVLNSFDSTEFGINPDCSIVEVSDECFNTTGIKTLKNKNAISVYPNPASSTITIHQSSPSPNQQLLITNILGEEIYHQPISNSTQTTINISQWSNGVYFYQLKSDKETLQGKFVVEK
jgi:uncharacterized repeat protein (TIGR03803 family)